MWNKPNAAGPVTGFPPKKIEDLFLGVPLPVPPAMPISPPPSPLDRRILFIDMNSFFASVEQQANPKLRGVPVGISPVDAPSGCIIAASYEAKRLGVEVGDSVRSARLKVPKIKIVISSPEKYLSTNRKLVTILEKYSWKMNFLSIDEAFMELKPNITGAEALKLAMHIKADILRLGDWLRASIGVAPNLFLAKAAAESHKPDGYTELLIADLPKFFAALPALNEIKGIKRGMSRRLWAVNINTPIEFYNASASYLRAALGVVGEYWYLRLHGFRIDERPDEPPKSIGHQHVLAPRFRTPEKARAVAMKLVERAAKRLRNHNLYASGVSLSVSYVNGVYWGDSRRVEPFKDSFSFWKHINSLFDRAPFSNAPVMMVSVIAYDLFDAPQQLKIFPEANRKTALSVLSDKINDRYGDLVIRPAGVLFDIDDAAPKRIPFGKIRY